MPPNANEPPHIKAIVDQIAQLKFYEVSILNEILKRDLNIPDVQQVVAASAAAPSDGAADASAASGGAAVKAEYSVKLTKFDESKKVALIKEIKKIVTGINLVEAKRFVEECPRVIKSNVSPEEAEELKKAIEAAGGTVKLE